MTRIFMLSSQLLFSRGVENLLSGHAGVEIVGRETDVATALDRIRELKPDVVILDSKDLASAPSPIVGSILKDAPCAKVIALNLTNDQIRVYHGEQHTAQNVDDLLEVIDQDTPELNPITNEEWMSLAAGRAQVYSFLTAIYNRSINEQLLKNLEAGSLKLIGSLEQGNDLTGDLHEGLHALERFQQELSSQSYEAVQLELEEEYARLLQSSTPGIKLIQACETAYVNMDQRGDSIRAELNRAYAASGLSLPANTLMPPDFIGCELDFMQQLCTNEYLAWSKNDRTQALNAQRQEHTFLRDHLIRWVPRFCDSLIMHTQLDFYRGIAGLTKGFILNEGYRVAELMEWISAAENGPAQTDRAVEAPA